MRPSARPAGMRLWELLTLADQTDEAGRLLLEDSAPKAAIEKAERQGIAMISVTCPYGDTPSRTGGLMNVSAYQALRRDTLGLLSGFAWLAVHYLELDPSKKGSVRALYDVSHLGLTLPIVLFGRGRDPIAPYGDLPSYVGSIFKASRGVFSAAVDLLNTKGPDAIITAADVVRFADERGHLKRPQTERACAAPSKLIERTLAVMLLGQGADPDSSGLGDLIEFERLWDFYSMEAEFSDALSNYGYVLNNLTNNAGISDPRLLFATQIRDEQGQNRTFGEITESLLRHADATQAGLNRLLGRTQKATSITFQDILKML